MLGRDVPRRGNSRESGETTIIEGLVGRLRKGEDEALAELFSIFRAKLRLRHFEDLNNIEAARVLGISDNVASNRYVRALQRLRQALSGIPGLSEP